jgi:LDH2 family malate/lactate/ureidoglycolate dehydrogenase
VALTQPQRAEHANVSHVFIAVDIARFIPVADFEERMDTWIGRLQASARVPGEDRIFVPGEKEWELEAFHRQNGVPLNQPVVTSLGGLGDRLGVPLPEPLAADRPRA